jgi:hypothetical protein
MKAPCLVPPASSSPTSQQPTRVTYPTHPPGPALLPIYLAYTPSYTRKARHARNEQPRRHVLSHPIRRTPRHTHTANPPSTPNIYLPYPTLNPPAVTISDIMPSPPSRNLTSYLVPRPLSRILPRKRTCRLISSHLISSHLALPHLISSHVPPSTHTHGPGPAIGGGHVMFMSSRCSASARAQTRSQRNDDVQELDSPSAAQMTARVQRAMNRYLGRGLAGC